MPRLWASLGEIIMPAEINFNLPGNKKSEHNSRDKIAVVYARYSSHSQTEQSIEGQLAAAQAYAAAHDYTIVHGIYRPCQKRTYRQP